MIFPPQAIAWTSAPHRVIRDPFTVGSDRVMESPLGPDEKKLPELQMAPKPEPVYLKR